MAMARNASFGAVSAGEDRRDVVLEGVFIHPDHLAQGFSFDDDANEAAESDSSSLIGYEMDDTPVTALTGLALSCATSAQEETQDYFAPRPGSSNLSPFYTDSTTSSDAFSSLAATPSPSSSAATTPTCEADLKAPTFSRRSSTLSIYTDAPSPAIPATFSFSAFSQPQSAPLARAPRAPSPTRVHPYTRPSGAAMSRSVSSPVETQRQVEDRQRRMSLAEGAMDQRAVKMARSRSTASSPTLGSFPVSASAPMSRTSSAGKPLFSPLSQPAGNDWCSLPMHSPGLGSFPYPTSRPSLAPLRISRAQSYAGVENHSGPMASSKLYEHRASLPDMPLAASPVSSPTSPMVRQNRRHSRLFPLTPILPQSPELPAGSARTAQVAAASTHEAPVAPRVRLHRGMTF
ncbi:uncharacterized protein JCM10292_001502 [Rhodotorula paludigena]|uniref:uncharacterized protein n=1 Tax=Rhodotorula paludigena TaxID=86838 RepID=UPI00318058DB